MSIEKVVSQDELDQIVLGIYMDMAVDEMNKTDCEEEQETILCEYELKASDKNNQGRIAQIDFSIINGVKFEALKK